MSARLEALEQRRLLAVVAVSENAAGTGTGDAASKEPGPGVVSADGRFVVFSSSAANLLTGVNSKDQVIRRDLSNNTSVLVSVATNGSSVGNGVSDSPWVSVDGRFVAFDSTAKNLNAKDTDAVKDVYVRDMVSGTTELVSVGTSGKAAAGTLVGISRDGRYVVFTSSTAAGSLVAGLTDTNGAADLFVRDRVAGTTKCVSVNVAGTATGNFDSVGATGNGRGVISDDGRYVLMASNATDLVGGFVEKNVDFQVDLYVRDVLTGKTDLVTVAPDGLSGANGEVETSIMTPDGRYVVFETQSDNLVPAGQDTNPGARDIYLRDRVAKTTTLISKGSNGVTGLGESFEPFITPEGRFIAFTSQNGLLPIDQQDGLNTQSDIYLFDRVSNKMALVSVNKSGNKQVSDSGEAAVSDDGRFVTFESAGNDISAENTLDADDATDTYVRDMSTGVTHWLSVHTAPVNDFSSMGFPLISADGSKVVFASGSNSIVSGDGNGFGTTDVFAADVPGGQFAQFKKGVLTVHGSPLDDAISVSSASGKITATRNGVSMQFAAGSVTAVVISGGDGNDNISGSPLGDVIDGGAGDDRIFGNDGNDHIFGGDGNDFLNGNAGKDVIDGGLGNDRVNGHGGNDQLYGGAGVDRLYGYDGSDYLDGGSSGDRLDGGNGADTMLGEGGNDRFFAKDQTVDQLFGGKGSDTAETDVTDVATTVEVVTH